MRTANRQAQIQNKLLASIVEQLSLSYVSIGGLAALALQLLRLDITHSNVVTNKRVANRKIQLPTRLNIRYYHSQ